jgi:dipeptidyl aminopeptidase/acylaminoacyl peptidase
MPPIEQRYGLWPSPITEQWVAAANVRYRQVAVDGNAVYWIEQRPEQGGAYQLCLLAPGGMVEPLADHYSLRSTVYGYGGGALAVAEGLLCFVHRDSHGRQYLYRRAPGEAPQLIANGADSSYGDLHIDLRRRRVLLVEERRLAGADADLSLRSYALDTGKTATVLAAGADFYSSPALSPDGRQLAYLTWQRPNMPWDNNELWCVDLDDAGAALATSRRRIAGNTHGALLVGESIVQPQWSPDGRYLYFVSDRSNWWSLYRYDCASGTQTRVAALSQAEFATPQWELGMQCFTVLPNAAIAATFYRHGEAALALINFADEEVTEHKLFVPEHGAVTAISHLHTVVCGHGQQQRLRLVFIGGGPQFASTLLEYDPASKRLAVLGAPVASLATLPISTPEAISFPVDVNTRAHGFYYPPHHPDYRGPTEEKPPLLIKSHGGPTSAANSILDWSTQYFTSRGFAVLDINYRGSSGYGRHYRHALYGQWGIADRADCLAAIDYLAAQYGIDNTRVIARGCSAGGYLTLVLATFTRCLRAGASYAGISNLQSLYHSTHKFEKYYLQRLLDPQLDCAKARSPLFALERLATPLFLVQGMEDTVVPLKQTQRIAEAMTARGIAAEVLYFDDEQHGLRRGENIARALQQEWAFYLRHLAFNTATPPKT